ncbi:MAG TPA: TonB family protein, partial [Woeseiaceae bacterium]
ATAHAEAAWQAAEEALGDDAQTATLAYNYSRLVLFNDAHRARDALRRVNNLQEAGVSSLHAGELQLYSAYADFVVGGQRRRDADRVSELLTAWDTNRDLGSDLIVMWLNLGQAYLAERQFRRAQDTAERTEAVILETMPDNVHFRAQAVMINGVARLVTRNRTVGRTQAAHNEFSRAMRFFPPQKDLDSFDPLLARILAWDGAAQAALRSLGHDEYPDHSEPDYQELPRHPLFVHEELADCAEIEWAEKSAPRFPSEELRRGTIGSVYVGFALGEDLRVRDVRVMAEVPASNFGDAALKALSGWRAEALPPGDPACHQNFVTRFTFAID